MEKFKLNKKFETQIIIKTTLVLPKYDKNISLDILKIRYMFLRSLANSFTRRKLVYRPFK